MASTALRFARFIGSLLLAAVLATLAGCGNGPELPTQAIDSAVTQIGGGSIETLIAKLTEHGMIALGEHGDVTPEVSREVYQVAV